MQSPVAWRFEQATRGRLGFEGESMNVADQGEHPTISDLRAARRRLAGVIVDTPILRSDVLDGLCGGRVFIKAECLQMTGAFKVRGAYNRLLQFTEAEKHGGVVTWSSGNHGQAIAAAAKRLGMPALILMPSDSVLTKVELTRAHGGEVMFFTRGIDDAMKLGERLATERGAVIVPPANHPDIIAGQGTAALELLEQVAAAGAPQPDMLFVPCGSGGLTAGCSIAFDALNPDAQVYAVEPEAFDDTGRSLTAGERLGVIPGGRTICDALTARIPAPLTFAINAALGVKALAISDGEARRAMAFAFRHLKVVMEPGGAAGLAAVLAGKVDVRGKTIAIICSGGNVDADVFSEALASGDMQ